MTTECIRYSTVSGLRERLNAERKNGKSIGFLATMGALHEGHLTLAHELANSADIRVASVFVNPTQFNDPKDFEAYHINIDSDQAALESAGVEILFAPSVDEMYPRGFQTTVLPGELAKRWEGEARPGHFEGVATVVTMLLTIVAPDFTIFGEKDFQQLRVVERLVQDLKLPVVVLRGKLVREVDGLAMSSRNARLTPENRIAAAGISRGLMKARDLRQQGEMQSERLLAAAMKEVQQIPGHVVDYLAVVDERTLEPISVVNDSARLLTVVRVQGVRLLDNVGL